MSNDNDEVKIEPETEVVEEFVPEDGEGNTVSVEKRLRERIKVLEKEKQEYLDGWQRSKADYVNFEKRAKEERKELIKYSNEGLIGDLTPVLDSFDMAMGNKTAWESVPANWRTGVEYIYNKLLGILSENGLKEFVPKVGDKFDPALHVADEMVPTDKPEEDGVIVSVKKKGYKLADRIVVVPQVRVGELKK